MLLSWQRWCPCHQPLKTPSEDHYAPSRLRHTQTGTCTRGGGHPAVHCVCIFAFFCTFHLPCLFSRVGGGVGRSKTAHPHTHIHPLSALPPFLPSASAHEKKTSSSIQSRQQVKGRRRGKGSTQCTHNIGAKRRSLPSVRSLRSMHTRRIHCTFSSCFIPLHCSPGGGAMTTHHIHTDTHTSPRSSL